MSIEWVRAENAVYVNGKLFGTVSRGPHRGSYHLDLCFPWNKRITQREYLYLTHRAAKAALIACAQEEAE